MSSSPWYKRILGATKARGPVEGTPDHCQELRAGASDFIDGDMPLSVTRRIKQHLGLCSGCDSWMKSFASTVKLIHGIPKEKLPESLRQRLTSIGKD